MCTMKQILFSIFTCSIFFYNKRGFLGSFADERELQGEPGFPRVPATPPGRLLYVAPAQPCSLLKVITNVKKGGLTAISFEKSRFKLFSRNFSNKLVQAPSCERPLRDPCFYNLKTIIVWHASFVKLYRYFKTVIDVKWQKQFTLSSSRPLTGSQDGASTDLFENLSVNSLKVPKREIFDSSDFPDFYTMKSLRVGDFGVKIKKNLKNI